MEEIDSVEVSGNDNEVSLPSSSPDQNKGIAEETGDRCLTESADIMELDATCGVDKEAVIVTPAAPFPIPISPERAVGSDTEERMSNLIEDCMSVEAENNAVTLEIEKVEEVLVQDNNTSISVSSEAVCCSSNECPPVEGPSVMELDVNIPENADIQEDEVVHEGREKESDKENGLTDNSKVQGHETEDYFCASSYYAWQYQISKTLSPKCLIKSDESEFQKDGDNRKKAKYGKGCKWAPDGSCLISCADDDNLRLFNFPSSLSTVTDWSAEDEHLQTEDWRSVLKVKEGGLIYDYCWYPLMSSLDPVSSCFLSTSSEAPIHLWDAFTGKLRASYLPYNHLDQVISAYSLAFDPTGQNIYSGFQKSIRIFDITRPGRTCTLRTLKQKPPYNELNQCGIVASLAVNPQMSSFYAVGTFDKSIGLYYDDGSVICLLQGHAGGITHMKFSSDGLKLFTGGRRDSRLICWDMRQMGEAYKIYDRVVDSHQRIYFDVTSDNRYLISGGTDGIVKIWDLLVEENEPCCSFKSNNDCVNGASLNPYLPILATSSGQRHYYEIADDSDEEIFVESKSSRERSCDIRLWKLAQTAE